MPRKFCVLETPCLGSAYLKSLHLWDSCWKREVSWTSDTPLVFSYVCKESKGSNHLLEITFVGIAVVVLFLLFISLFFLKKNIYFIWYFIFFIFFIFPAYFFNNFVFYLLLLWDFLIAAMIQHIYIYSAPSQKQGFTSFKEISFFEQMSDFFSVL